MGNIFIRCSMKEVTVFGAGLMGSDIGILFANAGFTVNLVDINKDALERARIKHREAADDLVEKGIIQSKNIIDNISYITDLSVSKGSEFIFEAITEDLGAKQKLMSMMEDFVDTNVPIATNTSSYTASEISIGMRHPERLCAMHFSNPPLEMRLIEVVPGIYTKPEIINTVLDLSRKLGKSPILIRKECRGFVLNRILYAGFTEGLLSMERGDKKEDIDNAIKMLGMPFGLIEGLDLIGLDTAYRIFLNLQEAYGERFKIPEHLLKDYIQKGELGKKTGKGFYRWRGDEAMVDEGGPYDPTLIIAVTVNEAYRLINEGVVDREGIDEIFKLALNVPIGIIELGESLEITTIREKLREAYRLYNHEVYNPEPLTVV